MELNNNELAGYATITGKLSFCDLLEPGGAANYAPKFSSTILVPKDSPDLERLWAVVERIVAKTWGEGNVASKMEEIEGAIQNGIAPKYSPIWVQDGDLYSPEYNSGTFVVKATRRVDQGRPVLMNTDGAPIFEGSDVVSSIEGAPGRGDLVSMVMRVWAMKQHDRVNFTVEGVRRAIGAQVTAGAPNAATQAALSALATAELPTSLPAIGAPAAATPAAIAAPTAEVLAPEEAPTEQPAAPTSTKRQSLFRGPGA